MGKTSLNVLIIEDSEFDAQILVNLLWVGGYEANFRRVESAVELEVALSDKNWDVILADYNLPEFQAPEALEIVKKSEQDLPFIVISGGIGEDVAVAMMKAGAHDYLMKGNLARLVPAVERELREAEVRNKRRSAEEALKDSEMRYRLLWESSPDGVLLMDSGGLISFTNPAVTVITGYSNKELISRRLEDIQSPGLPESQKMGLSFFKSQFSGDESQIIRETLAHTRDGRDIDLEIAFGSLSWQGRNWCVAFMRDITRRKQTEAALRHNEDQLMVAKEIQQGLFPDMPPIIPGFDIAGSSIPAEAAGGDYYDFLELFEGGHLIVVGDVTGHGIGAALLMSETRAYLRILSKNRSDPGLILSRLNRVLAEDVGFDRFITMLLIRIDPDKRQLTYSNAGHPKGFILNINGEITSELTRSEVPLGLGDDTNYTTESKISLHPGDLVLMLTDGFEEASSPDDEFFGNSRILNLIRKHRKLSPDLIIKHLRKEVEAFTGNQLQTDDLTAVIIKVAE